MRGEVQSDKLCESSNNIDFDDAGYSQLAEQRKASGQVSMESLEIESSPRTLPLRDRLRWMSSHWAVYRAEVPLLLGLTLANAGVLVAYPYLLKQIIDGIEDSLSPAFIWRQVGWLFVLGVLHFFIYAVMQYRRALLNLKFEFGARLRAFESVLRMGPEFFSRFRTGDVVTRLNDDVTEKISWFLCSGIFRVIEAATLIVFGVAMMLLINPQLTLYTATPLPFLVGLFVLTGHQLHRRYDAVQKSISELNDSLESCFSGIRVIKAFGVEDHQQRLVEHTIEQQRRAEIQAVRWQTIIDSLYGNIWQLAIVAVLLAGGTMAIAGEITLGDLIAFDTYVLLLVWPMFDIGQFFVRGKLCAVGIDRVAEVENDPPEVVIPETPPPVARHISAPLPVEKTPAPAATEPLVVKFDRVTYQYPASPKPAVNDVTFHAKPGTLTALVGEVGAGKSTLLQLIPRLMDPTGGSIRVADRDARHWPADELRSRLGFVPQEPHLLSGTMEDNIRFGRLWVNEDAVQNAIEIAQLQNEVAEWPTGLQTVVGSRGVRLSGGQKQRVSLARALAGRPSILLLDDCTASLDAETETALWNRLTKALPECTTLLVTHRPATLERADQILVLDNGQIVESGTFAELEHEGTTFHRLYVAWKLQEEL